VFLIPPLSGVFLIPPLSGVFLIPPLSGVFLIPPLRGARGVFKDIHNKLSDRYLPVKTDIHNHSV